jgi:hypothetical protein
MDTLVSKQIQVVVVIVILTSKHFLVSFRLVLLVGTYNSTTDIACHLTI